MIHIEPHCLSCGGCLRGCPLNLFKKGETQYFPHHQERCINCGHCVGICPVNALKHDRIDQEISLSLNDDQKNILDGFLARRSIRTFNDKAVDDGLLKELIHLGAQAPAAKNQRNFKIIALKDQKKKDQLLRWIGSTYQKWSIMAQHPLKKRGMKLVMGKRNFQQFLKTLPLLEKIAMAIEQGKDPIFYRAPVILLICGQRGRFKRDDAVYLAAELGHLAAIYKLGSCIIGFAQAIFDQGEKIPAEILSLPPKSIVFQTMILGESSIKYSGHFFRESYPLEII